MQVFKQYFRIVKKSALSSLLLYMAIFIFMTIIFSNVGNSTDSTSFETEKCKVAVLNNDNSPLSNNLEAYIKENSKLVKIKTTDEGIRDALFFREAEIVITIPKGFEDSFLQDNYYTLETQSIPNSSSSIFIKSMINNYLNTTKVYIDNTKNLDFEKISDLVNKDLSIDTEVTLAKDNKEDTKSSVTYYFNYLAYPMLCMLILGISIVSNIFNSPDLKRRNLCSPINSYNFNMQIFLGDMVLALSTWTIFMALAIVMYPKDMFSFSGVLHGINSLIFTITCLCLSFLISNISTKNSIGPISNLVSLGCCFLGGAFVPQQLLSETVKSTAIFNPVYWFINVNDKLNALSTFNMDTLTPLLFEMLIMLAFSVAFLGVGLVIMKQRRTKY